MDKQQSHRWEQEEEEEEEEEEMEDRQTVDQAEMEGMAPHRILQVLEGQQVHNHLPYRMV